MQGSKLSATRTSAAPDAGAASAAGGAAVLRRLALCGAAALFVGCGGCAQVSAQGTASTDPVKELAAPPAIELPLKPSLEFAKFPSYAGTLGSRRIVLRLGAKTDDPSGVHGEYQFEDTGAVILIAGDRDGDTLEVEESNDGTHITGNWVGKFAADGSLAGDRMNVDDSDPQPFDLRPLAAGQAAAPAGAKPAASAAAPAPAAAKPGGAAAPEGSAVGGVGNLKTGD